MRNILAYEWLYFIRRKTMWISWLMMLAAGLYAIHFGHSFLSGQQHIITTLDTSYNNRLEKQLKNFRTDTSSALSREAYEDAHDPFMNEWLTKPLVRKIPSGLQGLSIGQSDHQPFYFGLWIYNDNVYTTRNQEIRNPDKLLAGNFDLSFVVIYLFPLLIIAYGYNMVSHDREQRTLRLLLSQGISVDRLIAGRLLFRFLLILFLFVLLSAIGGYAVGVHASSRIVQWLITGTLYISFWFSLLFAVVRSVFSSALSGILLIGLWIGIVLVIPSAVNTTIVHKDPEGVEMSDAEREYGGHLWELWQEPGSRLTDTLMQVKPEWNRWVIRDTNKVKSIAYSYLSILHVNQIGWQADSLTGNAYRQLNRYAILNPAYTAQHSFNRLAETEGHQFMLFRQAAATYRLTRAAHLAELRMREKPFAAEDFFGYPQFVPPTLHTGYRQWLQQTWPLAVSPVIIILLSLLFNRKQRPIHL